MLLSSFAARKLAVGLLVLATGVVSSQDYPNKPVRIITAGAGGGVDFTARLIAQLQSPWRDPRSATGPAQ